MVGWPRSSPRTPATKSASSVDSQSSSNDSSDVPLGVEIRVSIGIFSYAGQLTFGISADYDEVPDVGVLAAGIEAALAELVALAE